MGWDVVEKVERSGESINTTAGRLIINPTQTGSMSYTNRATIGQVRVWLQ